MSEIITTTSVALPQVLPAARVQISVRAGVLSDLKFLDELQRKQTHAVGWMPTAQFEGKIKAGHVLVAEEVGGGGSVVGGGSGSILPTTHNPLPTRVGYAIGNDQYFKRDDLGIIYQLNILPDYRRSLVGATLLKAMFDKSAWGCRLFCCWCAQDLEANHFWEACGFVPLAFRTGSRTKGKGGTPRVHIFWQKRIRDGDHETAWWFPSETKSGSFREDRLVLPIPPGTHWSEAKPVILPGGEKPALESRVARPKRPKPAPVVVHKFARPGGISFVPTTVPQVPVEKPKPEKQPKQKNDPKHVAAARELRDRYLDEVNRTGNLLPAGKYDVARALIAPVEASVQPSAKLLSAA